MRLGETSEREFAPYGILYYISPALANLVVIPEGVLLRCAVQSLDWFAHLRAGLGCSMTIRKPTELRDELRQLAEAMMRLATSSDEPVPEAAIITAP